MHLIVVRDVNAAAPSLGTAGFGTGLMVHSATQGE